MSKPPANFVELDIKPGLIAKAQKRARVTGRDYVVGHDSYFGWRYADAEDTGSVASLGCRILVYPEHPGSKCRNRYKTSGMLQQEVIRIGARWFIERYNPQDYA